MKILLIQKSKYGGVGVQVNLLKKYLEIEGFKVDVISRNEDLKIKSFFESLFKINLYKKIIKKYDIIHAHDWSIIYPLLNLCKNKLIGTFHGFPTNPVAKIFQEYVYKILKEKIIVVSPKLLRKYPKAQYIPNAIDHILFDEILKQKVSYDKDKKYYIVGINQKYNYNKIKKIVNKFPNLKLKYVTGRPYEDMPNFYKNLDIFISIPPKTAGFNSVWIEAMYSDIPYIIGTTAGVGEFLPIYKVDNVEELKILLNKIINNKLPSLKNSKEWIIKNKFLWVYTIKSIIKVYEKI